MIWPELLDENGDVVRAKTSGNIAKQGKANMWVVDETRRQYHAERIKIGTKGTWWRGGHIKNRSTTLRWTSLTLRLLCGRYESRGIEVWYGLR